MLLTVWYSLGECKSSHCLLLNIIRISVNPCVTAIIAGGWPQHPDTYHACKQNINTISFECINYLKTLFLGSISRCPGFSANEESVPQSRLRVHPSPGHRHHCSQWLPHQAVESSRSKCLQLFTVLDRMNNIRELKNKELQAYFAAVHDVNIVQICPLPCV